MNGAAAKILVVDDEAIARANLARVLAHDCLLYTSDAADD